MTTTWTTPHTWTSEVITTALQNAIRDELNHLKEAADVTMTNGSGVSLIEGDVLVQDLAADTTVTTTTTAGDTGRVWVATGTIATPGAGYCRAQGPASVKVTGAVTWGDALETSTSAKAAHAGTTAPFAIALEDNPSGTAVIKALLIPRPPAGPSTTGTIPLSIMTARIITTNDITVSGAGDGGVVSKDTSPRLERVNAATDKSLMLVWPAGSVVEVQFEPFVYPADLDAAQPIVLHFLAGMTGGTNTPVLTASYWEGVGDTNAGGNTAALGSSIVEKTVTIAAADVGVPPKMATVTLLPGSHGTDDLRLVGAWASYQRTS